MGIRPACDLKSDGVEITKYEGLEKQVCSHQQNSLFLAAGGNIIYLDYPSREKINKLWFCGHGRQKRVTVYSHCVSTKKRSS